MVYKCKICGHKYDETVEGVKFADLPDDWKCPICGVGKDMFEPEG
jgi:rubredoxin